MTLAFAHRGAPGRGRRENTLPAFRDALASGATALESDVWLTADDVPVLVHDPVIWHRWWRRRLRDLAYDDLPEWLPTLASLYDDCGKDFDLSLDLKDPAGVPAVIAAADAVGVTSRLWLCAPVPLLVTCRQVSPNVRLANSATLEKQGLEPLLATLAAERIDALNLRAPEWTAERVAAVHDAGVQAFAWDVNRAGVLERVREYGCDAIYSDSLDLLRVDRES